jgi:hypothetical protein
MIRQVAVAVSLLSVAVAGCGGNKRPARNANAPAVVIADKDVGEKAAEMPQYWAILSKKHGCAVDYTPVRTIADCHDEGVIGLGRRGTHVIVACEGWMSAVQCKNLFDAIAAEGRQ